MTPPATLDRPVIMRALSSKTQTCTRTGCGATIAVGDPIGFDCTAGPDVLCGSCCDARHVAPPEPTQAGSGAVSPDDEPTTTPPLPARLPAPGDDGPFAGEPTGPAKGSGFRILFTGSRNYTDKDLAGVAFENALAEVTGTVDVDEGIAGLVTVVHGDGDGLDHIIAGLAGARRCVVEAHPAAWGREGRLAGPLRNGRMTLLGADLCVALVDGMGPGTADCIEKAEAAGIPVRRVSRENPQGVRTDPEPAPADAGRPDELVDVPAGEPNPENGGSGAVPGARRDDADRSDVVPRAAASQRVGAADGPAAHSGAATEQPAPATAGSGVDTATRPDGETAGEARPAATNEGVADDAAAGTAPVADEPAGVDDAAVAAWVDSVRARLAAHVAQLDSDQALDEPAPAEPCGCDQPDAPGSHRADQPCAITSTVDGPAPLFDFTPWQGDAVGYGTDPNVVAAEFVEAIRLGILAGDLRGRQKEIGPSEVGHPCPRALAYRLAGTPHTGTEPTPWRQRIGTLVHADNDDHAAGDNERRGVRWLTNLRVRTGDLYPGRPIDGTLDVFDVQTGTVIDEKVPGSTAMKTYGPGKPEAIQYRTQVQLYGRGVLLGGMRPAWVSTLRLSPARELSEYVFKPEPFDEQVAVDALSRAGGIARMVDQLGARAPELLPPVEHVCHRCPWLRRNSTDLTTGCPGAPGADLGRTRASVDDLVG